MDKSKKINVLVTAAGGFSHGYSIYRALMESKLNLNMFLGDMSPRMIESTLLSQRVLLPSASDPNYFETLVHFCTMNDVHAVFTGSEQELVALLDKKKDFEKRTKAKLFINSPEVISLCKRKSRCTEKLRSLGFRVPRSVKISNEFDLKKIDFFPVIIKPDFESGASLNVFYIEEMNELIAVGTLLKQKNIDLVVQEYISFDDNEYTVGVTCDLEGRLVSSIAMRKIIEGPSNLVSTKNYTISSGISQGYFVNDKESTVIKAECEKIALAIGSRGPINIQLRYSNNEVIPFEINPRFSGTTSARALAGYNEPEYFIKRYVLSESCPELRQLKNGLTVKTLNERFIESS